MNGIKAVNRLKNIDNFYITSNVINNLCPPDLIPIYIEASRAFGTGDHSTTSLCIKAMNLIKSEKINNILRTFNRFMRIINKIPVMKQV